MGSVSSVTSVMPHGIARCLTLGERSLLEHGDLGASRSWFDAGYAAAEAAGQASEMAQAALGLGGLWVHEHRTAAAAAAVECRQRQALAMLDPVTPLACGCWPASPRKRTIEPEAPTGSSLSSTTPARPATRQRLPRHWAWRTTVCSARTTVHCVRLS